MLVKTLTMFLHVWVDSRHIRALDPSQSVTIYGREVSYIPLPEIVTETHTHRPNRVSHTINISRWQ